MATIKFYLQSKNDNAQIYLRLSNGRNTTIKKKIGLTINFKNWDSTKGFPKNINSAEVKLLKKQLQELEAYITNQLNNDLSNGTFVDSDWLEKQINKNFGRIEVNENTLVVEEIQHYIDIAQIRQKKGGKIGLKDSTLKSYSSFKKIIESYQKYLKKKIHFKDINQSFLNDFTNWMLNTQKYSINYAGQKRVQLRSVLVNAIDEGKPVPEFAKSINVIKESSQDRHIQTLSFKELEHIYKTPMPSKVLEDSKKWLIIGCFIGQRQSDLLKINSNNISISDKGICTITLVQKKTEKKVIIPVLEPYVKDIVLNDFPDYVSEYNFGEYIKEVCRLAGINETQKGYIIENDRKVLGNYPKYKLLSSHTCRRSFATNFYKMMNTSILIGITGHSTESMFLKYINQDGSQEHNADLFEQNYGRIQEVENKPKMTIIKKAN